MNKVWTTPQLRFTSSLHDSLKTHYSNYEYRERHQSSIKHHKQTKFKCRTRESHNLKDPSEANLPDPQHNNVETDETDRYTGGDPQCWPHTGRAGHGEGGDKGRLGGPVGTIEVVVGGFLDMTRDALPGAVFSGFL